MAQNKEILSCWIMTHTLPVCYRKRSPWRAIAIAYRLVVNIAIPYIGFDTLCWLCKALFGLNGRVWVVLIFRKFFVIFFGGWKFRRRGCCVSLTEKF